MGGESLGVRVAVFGSLWFCVGVTSLGTSVSNADLPGESCFGRVFLPCPMCRCLVDNSPPQRLHVLTGVRRCPRICAGLPTAIVSRREALWRSVIAVGRRCSHYTDLADCGVGCAPSRRAICGSLSTEAELVGPSETIFFGYS